MFSLIFCLFISILLINLDNRLNNHCIFNSIIELPSQSLKKLQDITTSIEYPKGHILFYANKTDRDLYFIQNGIARVFYLEDVNEVTIQFGFEKELLLSLNGYIENKAGYENIELLETSTLLHIRYNDLQLLYQEDIEIANWGRRLIEKEIIKTEARLMSRLFKTASLRYFELLNKYPNLLQRVKLGHIASYLGITQVTLSRIRANNK